MKITSYNPNKKFEIKELFTKTFTDSEGETEGLLIGNLVRELIETTLAQDLYGFVAVEDEQIVGGIFFSRMRFERPVEAFILSPVAVHPEFQQQGTGQKLINYGIAHLKKRQVELLFTYGDPNYYSKVGFKPISEKTIKAPLKLTHPEGWLAQSLIGDEVPSIAGNSSCVAALNKQEYW